MLFFSYKLMLDTQNCLGKASIELDGLNKIRNKYVPLNTYF